MSLRLVRRPKSPHWIIRGTVRGIRVEESSGTGDKRVAEEIRAKREAQILAELVYGRRAANRSNVLERGVRFDCTIGLWALFWKGDVSFDPHSSDRGRHNAAGLGLVTLKRGFRVKTAVVLTDKGRAVAAQVVGRLRDTRAHKKNPSADRDVLGTAVADSDTPWGGFPAVLGIERQLVVSELCRKQCWPPLRRFELKRGMTDWACRTVQRTSDL